MEGRFKKITSALDAAFHKMQHGNKTDLFIEKRKPSDFAWPDNFSTNHGKLRENLYRNGQDPGAFGAFYLTRRLSTPVWSGKTRTVGLPDGEKILRICVTV